MLSLLHHRPMDSRLGQRGLKHLLFRASVDMQGGGAVEVTMMSRGGAHHM
jgi:hypothetical protein